MSVSNMPVLLMRKPDPAWVLAPVYEYPNVKNSRIEAGHPLWPTFGLRESIIEDELATRRLQRQKNER